MTSRYQCRDCKQAGSPEEKVCALANKHSSDGIELRDIFAMAIMTTLVNPETYFGYYWTDHTAIEVYKFADKLIKAREATREK